MSKKPVLLISANYVPLGQIDWRKALDLVQFREKADMLEAYSCGGPAVVRLNVKIPDPYRWRGRNKYSKLAVFKRDGYTCVYCGFASRKATNLTIDHVLPRSRGGSNSYQNCVTSCAKCNSWKGCSTPEEAGMRMLYGNPGAPVIGSLTISETPPEWRVYLGST